MSKVDLRKFHKRVYSQFGQDGILEKIFEIIGLTNKYLIEFGSYGTMDGMGNTPYMRERFGMDGLLMDGSPPDGAQFPVQKHIVTSDNINELFIKYEVPKNFDFLSIDIDGNDFHVWQKITEYYPRVVSLECSPHFPANLDTVQTNTLTYSTPHGLGGCSLLAATNLAKSKGYSLVGYAGCDAFFVIDTENPNELFENVNSVDDIFSPLFETIIPGDQFGHKPSSYYL